MASTKAHHRRRRRNLGRWADHVKLLEGLDDRTRSTALDQYIEDHPEKYLLAYAFEQIGAAGIDKLDHENDKNLVLAINIVTCISKAIQKPNGY